METNSTVKIINKKTDKVQSLFIFSMLVVPIAAFLFFYVYININSFLMAFQRPIYGGSGGVKWGFDNFTMFFSSLSGVNSDILLALRNTLIFFCTNIFILRIVNFNY